ncbi:MAG: ferredoxin:glutaredoxin reductase [Candidatus Bathyarchaeota archaeon]|nr:ferredoxin:glutaredoxin reductase [Candidatus Bathyarchaeota archaeon]
MTTIEEVKRRAEADAKTFGYYLNPDPNFLQGLLEGLKRNEERYGYPSCPCRLASGNLDYDRDIICPCDYRDPDVAQFGACYCGLYVRKDVYEHKTELAPVPERRPAEKQMRSYQSVSTEVEAKAATAPEREELVQITVGKKKLWYCKQCGYVVFREDPPYICPVCKAKRELFAEIKTKVDFFG